MIKLVALDLDQTLFGADLLISPRVHRTVQQVISNGIAVTIATGREARLAARFAADLGLRTPVIAAQGGCIYDHCADRVLHDVRLPTGLLPKILKSAHDHHWNIHFEMFDRLFFPEHSNHPPALFELLRYSNWARVGDLLKDMPEPPHKLIVTVTDPADRPRVLAEMHSALGSDLALVTSHPHLVEALPHGVNKRHGLEWLAGSLDVNRSSVLAIGDSEADIPMLEWAGIGVAMGNASPDAKAVADWIAPTVAEDGAAIALERFVLASGNQAQSV